MFRKEELVNEKLLERPLILSFLYFSCLSLLGRYFLLGFFPSFELKANPNSSHVNVNFRVAAM